MNKTPGGGSRKSTKMLRFDKTPDAFQAIARKKMIKGDLWGALNLLRHAQEKNGSQDAITMDIAEILAQMGLYELSCEALCEVLAGSGPFKGESLFAIGCNFMALGYDTLCRDALTRYYGEYSDGEYSADCADMLESLDYIPDTGDLPVSAAQSMAESAKDQLDMGMCHEAAKTLERALALDPGLVSARKNLAVAHYGMRNYKRAIVEISTVLLNNPGDIGSMCNLAIFLNAEGHRDEALGVVSKAVETHDIDDDEHFKIAITLADLGLDEQALEFTAKMLKYSPFAPQPLFINGVARYNTGDAMGAYRAFSKLLLLEPENPAYAHVHRIAARDARSAFLPVRLSYLPVLPPPYIAARVTSLNQWAQSGSEAMRAAWREDERIRSYASWAFTLGDDHIKLLLSSALAETEDRRAAKLLKTMLLSLDQSDRLKRGIVSHLSAHGRQGPFLAVIGDNLAKVSVKTIDGAAAKSLPARYERVIARANRDLSGTGCAQKAFTLWVSYAFSLSRDGEPLPRLHSENAWAAALVICALDKYEDSVAVQDVAKRFGTRTSAVKKRVDILLSEIEDGFETSYDT